jgi:hypothetical protein
MLMLGDRVDISSYHELEVCTVVDKKKSRTSHIKKVS